MTAPSHSAPQAVPGTLAARPLGVEPAAAVCYSGYRAGQSPIAGVYPSRQQIREDLHILRGHWSLLRLYDSGPHAETVLEVVRAERLGFRVMLGADLAAEVSNPACPWGGVHPEERLELNRRENERRIEGLAALANRYPDVVFSVSAGNEATVDWSDHLVPVERVVDYVRVLRREVRQPVTFCENWVPWHGKLDPLAAELDFLSVHSYPIWESKAIDEAMAWTRENHRGVAVRHPGKPVVITEAGWATRSGGRGIRQELANEELQERYHRELAAWSSAQGVLVFAFEAFDEPWKGSPDPGDPEKHWGLFTAERRPKRAARALLPGHG